MTKKKFDYEEIDVGFYDHIYQKNFHLVKKY